MLIHPLIIIVYYMMVFLMENVLLHSILILELKGNCVRFELEDISAKQNLECIFPFLWLISVFNSNASSSKT